jgi:hypothetical protein
VLTKGRVAANHSARCQHDRIYFSGGR